MICDWQYPIRNQLINWAEVLRPIQSIRVMSGRSVYLITLFLDRLRPLRGKLVFVHILSPETDNCFSWISGRKTMTIENISWSISTKECCRIRRGLNPWPPDHQSDAHPTEAPSRFLSEIKCIFLWFVLKYILLNWICGQQLVRPIHFYSKLVVWNNFINKQFFCFFFFFFFWLLLLLTQCFFCFFFFFSSSASICYRWNFITTLWKIQRS